MKYDLEKIILVVDSHHGVYSINVLFSNYDHLRINEIDKKVLKDIEKNDQYSENFIESCIEYIDNSIFEIDGVKYQAVQNEDIWLVPVNMELSEEWFI